MKQTVYARDNVRYAHRRASTRIKPFYTHINPMFYEIDISMFYISFPTISSDEMHDSDLRYEMLSFVLLIRDTYATGSK